LDIAEKNQNYMQMASAYNNIATCFDLKHNYEEAVVFYRKSYDVLAQEKENTAYSRAVSLTNLCNCSFKLHN
ncbi:tetratricopeptide repeat protein, partial [Erysipelatoclostridium ramosum]